MKVMAQSYYFMITRERINNSLLFLLPLVSKEGEKWQTYLGPGNFKKQETSFINGFSSDINKPWLDEHIFLVFNSDIKKEFDLAFIERNVNFTSMYNYKIKDKFYTIYALRVPTDYKKELELIKQGRCNKIDGKLKSKMTSFWSAQSNGYLSINIHSNDNRVLDISNDIIDEKDYIESHGEKIAKEYLEKYPTQTDAE